MIHHAVALISARLNQHLRSRLNSPDDLVAVTNLTDHEGKPAAAFGSFGWSGEAVKLIEDHLRNLKMKIVADGMTARFLPGEEESDALIKFGENFALSMGEKEAQA